MVSIVGAASSPQFAHASDVLTVVLAPLAVAISVGGFWIAIRQIRKTRTAAQSAERAATRTSRSLAQNHLLFLVPELQRVAAAIESAVDEDKAAECRQLLAHWTISATRARGLLRARGDIPKDLAAAFTGAFRRITDARAAIRDEPTELAAAMVPASKAIDKVLEEMGDLAGQMLGEAGADANSE